jgi:hypothetical protein
MRIGYFAYVEKRDRTKVHIVNQKCEPICGTPIGRDAQFQFCTNGAPEHAVNSYVECSKCKRVYQKMKEKNTL